MNKRPVSRLWILRSWRAICALVASTLLGVLPGTSLAQVETARTLAARSSIVVRGTVQRENASDEPLLPASANTVVIRVSRMYAGAEISGDQTGRNVTVILSRPSRFKRGVDAFFFGNPRFISKTLTIIDEGELPSTAAGSSADLEVGLQARRDQPIRDRLATASLVFRGKVESERPLPLTSARRKLRAPPSEHDPEWHVAQVRITTPLRGGQSGSVVLVIFPASRDIMWFNSPKLKPGMDAIFITHKPDKENTDLFRATGVTEFLQRQPAELVIKPFDVLPPENEARVRRLLG